ncbi:hypothetical protein UR09_06300, partial [Candidatus Nitromaritima sp. SCGC AAA799-A02]
MPNQLNSQLSNLQTVSSKDEIKSKLETVVSYIRSVQQQLRGFRNTILAATEEVQSVPINAGFWANTTAGQRANKVIESKKKELLNDLDLAKSELKNAEEKDPEAILETDEQYFTLPMLKAAVYLLKGTVHGTAGEFKIADELLRKSLDSFERPDTWYLLGLNLQDLKQPGKACEALQKCIDSAEEARAVLADNFEGIEAEAQEELQMLGSKKILNGWFVGSREILLALTGLTLFCILQTEAGGQEPNRGYTKKIPKR